MGYKWSAGEEVTAAKLNLTGGAPTAIWWLGQRYSDYSGEFAILSDDGRYILTGEASNTFYVYDSLKADNAFPRPHTTTVGSLSITPQVGCSVKDGETDYVIATSNGSTALYRYDPDGQNEAALTISGHSFTGVRRIGWDPNENELYVLDGASKAATAIEVFTLSGTTLTHDRSITLSSAPGNDGPPIMHIGSNYITIEDTSGISNVQLERYNKSTGTHIDSNDWGGWATSQQHQASVVNINTNDYYVITETESDTNGSLCLVRITPDS